MFAVINTGKLSAILNSNGSKSFITVDIESNFELNTDKIFLIKNI